MNLHPYHQLYGQVLGFAAIQATIGSLELSTPLSIATSVKTSQHLEIVRQEMRSYLIIACIFTAGTSLYLYAGHGWLGALSNILINIIVISWIYYEHNKAIRLAINNLSNNTST